MIVTVLALALASGPGPRSIVKTADTELQRVLQSAEPSVEKLASRADAFVDFGELARRALGKEWDKLSKQQRDDFSRTMKGLLRASYAQRAIADGRGGAKIEYGDEQVEGNEATVATTLLLKEERVPVLYRLTRADERASWRIYDVVTDDVSLVSTYADQFRQVISRKGFDGLLGSLKAKQEQLEKTSTASAVKRP